MDIRPVTLVIGLAIAAAYPMFSEDTSPDSIEQKVELAAERMNRGIAISGPASSGPNIVSATALGKTMIVEVERSQDWRGVVEQHEVARMMAQGLCNGSGLRELFDEGATIKVQQKTSTGSPLPSLLITSCDM